MNTGRSQYRDPNLTLQFSVRMRIASGVNDIFLFLERGRKSPPFENREGWGTRPQRFSLRPLRHFSRDLCDRAFVRPLAGSAPERFLPG